MSQPSTGAAVAHRLDLTLEALKSQFDHRGLCNALPLPFVPPRDPHSRNADPGTSARATRLTLYMDIATHIQHIDGDEDERDAAIHELASIVRERMTRGQRRYLARQVVRPLAAPKAHVAEPALCVCCERPLEWEEHASPQILPCSCAYHWHCLDYLLQTRPTPASEHGDLFPCLSCNCDLTLCALLSSPSSQETGACTTQLADAAASHSFDALVTRHRSSVAMLVDPRLLCMDKLQSSSTSTLDSFSRIDSSSLAPTRPLPSSCHAPDLRDYWLSVVRGAETTTHSDTRTHPNPLLPYEITPSMSLGASARAVADATRATYAFKTRERIEFTRDPYLDKLPAAATEECVICFDQRLEGENPVFLDCKHAFHRQCLLGSWKAGPTKQAARCPVCRRDLCVLAALQTSVSDKPGSSAKAEELWSTDGWQY